MNDLLAKRIMRKLETLPDERVYQVLDFIEFLESKYAERSAPGSTPFQRIAETVEDTLRAGKVSANVVRSTMDAMSAASRMVNGLAAAGKSVVDQVTPAPKPTEKTPGQAAESPPEKKNESA